MTGPQMLIASDEGHSDDTGTFIARTAARREAEVAEAIHQHRAPSLVQRVRGLFRGHADVPDAPDADGPGAFTAAIADWKSPVPRGLNVKDRSPLYTYDTDVAQADQVDVPTSGFVPQDVPGGVVHYDSVEPARPFAPAGPSAIPWAMWDTEANREPMQPQAWANHVAEELTCLPLFRETVAASAAYARTCLFGCRIDEDSWGERMVSAGVNILTAEDLPIVRMLMTQAAPEARQEAAA